MLKMLLNQHDLLIVGQVFGDHLLDPASIRGLEHMQRLYVYGHCRTCHTGAAKRTRTCPHTRNLGGFLARFDLGQAAGYAAHSAGGCQPMPIYERIESANDDYST